MPETQQSWYEPPLGGLVILSRTAEGVDAGGDKYVLGLREEATENAPCARRCWRIWCINGSLKVGPAMAAGVTDRLWRVDDLMRGIGV